MVSRKRRSAPSHDALLQLPEIGDGNVENPYDCTEARSGPELIIYVLFAYYEFGYCWRRYGFK